MLDETTLTQFTDVDAPVNLPDIGTLTDSQRKRMDDAVGWVSNNTICCTKSTWGISGIVNFMLD
jgi:hypothetical protein